MKSWIVILSLLSFSSTCFCQSTPAPIPCKVDGYSFGAPANATDLYQGGPSADFSAPVKAVTYPYGYSGTDTTKYTVNQTVDLKNGYSLNVLLDYAPQTIMGDRAFNQPRLTMEGILKWNDQVISAATSSSRSFGDLELTLINSRLVQALTKAGHAPTGVVQGFDWWVAVRDFTQPTNAADVDLQPVRNFLSQVGNPDEVLAEMTITCKVSAPGTGLIR